LRDRFDRRFGHVLDGILKRHAVDAARIRKPSHVGVESEDRRAVGSLVTANTFEDARAVMNHVAHHVNGRVFPIHELTVAPDTVVVIYRHGTGFLSVGRFEDTGYTCGCATRASLSRDFAT